MPLKLRIKSPYEDFYDHMPLSPSAHGNDKVVSGEVKMFMKGVIRSRDPDKVPPEYRNWTRPEVPVEEAPAEATAHQGDADAPGQVQGAQGAGREN